MASKPAFSARRAAAKSRPKTLTIRVYPPIRPRFLEMDMILDPRAAVDGPCERGWKRIFSDVTPLRTDRQGPAGGSQGEPLEHQDQAPLPAEPGQRHLHLGRARPQRAPARLDQCAEERRPQWRPRHLPDQGESRRAVAPRAGIEARDPEEGRQARAGEEGELRFSGVTALAVRES